MAKPQSWKPGQSGNPKGAPKRTWTWAGELEKAVQELDKNGTPLKEHIAKALVRETLKGNMVAAKELMNRMDGMPKQDTQVDGTLEVVITRGNK